MKIIHKSRRKSSKPVGNCSPGNCVKFDKRFHPDSSPNDIYLILEVCSTYAERTSGGYKTEKVGIANLSTGWLSFVCPDRKVTVLEAEVKVDGPRT